MPPQLPQQKPKFEAHTIALMVGTALFFDGFQTLLNFILMGWLVTPLAFLTFYLWFRMKGVNFASAKRAGTMGLGFLIEIMPIINTLPAWTLAVVLIILDIKKKELVGNSKPADNPEAQDKAA